MHLQIQNKLQFSFQMQQSLVILHMSHIELTEFLEKEELENPLLVVKSCGAGQRGHSEVEDDYIENIGCEVSFYDYVYEQIFNNCYLFSDLQYCVAKKLIKYLDKCGYLRDDMCVISQEIGYDENCIFSTIDILQKYIDPPGIFARSAHECLFIQLARNGNLNDITKGMLVRPDLVAKHDIKTLASIYGVECQVIGKYMKIIKSLSPYPAIGLDADLSDNKVCVPDLFLIENDCGVSVKINDETIPNVSLDEELYKVVSKNENLGSDNDICFVKDCYRRSSILVGALKKRFSTLLNVAGKIMSYQGDFIRAGVAHINAVSISDIANDLSLHASTVSRAINEKYIMTSYGLFSLRSFVSGNVRLNGSNSTESVNSVTIKAHIKEIIECEKRVLSDEEICSCMNTRGIAISRRTVTKYRNKIGFSSFSVRKREAVL